MSGTTIVILGADGQLGRQLARVLGDDSAWAVLPVGRTDLDITEAPAVEALVSERSPAWVVNCAAVTNVDQCERDPSAARVNADAVEGIARACTAAGSGLVQISTDFVFDGRSPRPYREDDPTGPLNAYARAKLRAEEYARCAPRHLIVRTAWMFGPGGRNFVDRILARAAARQPLRIVDDQVGSPSYAPDVAEGIARLLRAGAEGTCHLVNAGEASWYELARTAAEFAGIPAVLTPVSTAEFGNPVQRPAYSVLDCSKYVRVTGATPRRWKAALKDHVEQRKS